MPALLTALLLGSSGLLARARAAEGCLIDHCSAVAAPERVGDCNRASCQRCEEGWELELDRRTLLPTGQCSFKCTVEQQRMGCAPQSCSQDGTCSQCVPGFNRASTSAFLSSGPSCVRAATTVPMTFYMYRAQSDANYPPANTDMASAAGVMWYLHNEVVARRLSCPRKFHKTRVLRYKVQVFNPPSVRGPRQGQFGHFVMFDYGQCTNPGCEGMWARHGYMVGCQAQASVFQYRDSVWYSLPGACPSLRYDAPEKAACAAAAPGGSCAQPNGDSSCTWHAEPAGEVTIDELSGIQDHAAFCSAGHYEYDDNTDAGSGTSFWDDKANATRNDGRVRRMQQLFAAKEPSLETALELPEPPCDGW